MDCNKLAEDGIPELGIEFNGEEDAYKFYNKYASKMDFSIRKDYLNKDKDGVTTSKRYSCCKKGVKRKYEGDVMPKRARVPTKTGCGTKMIIVLFRGTMKYRVHNLVLEYNHELHIKTGESTTMIILRQQDVEFVVMRYNGGPERIVVFNRNDLNVRCSCKKYENEEILCRHALKVFNTMGIKTIPPEYVKR
ncbi:protein FAR1-RELATED SEQUENCE 5-like [Coffea arabica]|uniref:Protein FAR1-RELATED SEQUENCE 5-like n=1 Tax=Coffea arabica TaxID=13443 RepID=A0ABM4V9F9_COFAR